MNIKKLKNIIEKEGWGFVFSDRENIINTWILVQHADFDVRFQENFLREFIKRKDSLELGNGVESNLAMLEDRILGNKWGVQKYGSQWSVKNGKYFLIPVLKNENIDISDDDNKKNFEVFDLKNLDDVKGINKRRSDVGLSSLQEYANRYEEWKGSGYYWIES